MIKLKRLTEPKILQKNKSDWTRQLLEQMSILGSYGLVDEQYKNKYRKKEVQEQLEKMTFQKCSYCESYIGDTDYEHIEHHAPKSKYPHLAYEWSNMLWSCSICNNNKGSKYDPQEIYIDPTVDDPAEHFCYELEIICAKTKRGERTIEDLNLNREKLVKARGKVLHEMLVLISTYNKETDQVKKANTRTKISRMLLEECEYSFMCLECYKTFAK